MTRPARASGPRSLAVLASVAVVLGALALAAGARAHAFGGTFTAGVRHHAIAGIIRDLPRGGSTAPGGSGTRPSPGRTLEPRNGMEYEGGPVMHANRTHLVFWQPSGSGLRFDSGYEPLMERFLTQVAIESHHANNVYGISGQYYDTRGVAAYISSFGGAIVDTDVLPTRHCREPSTGPAGWRNCVTDAQLQNELTHVVAANRLTHTSGDVFFLVLPAGLGTCTDTSSQMCALGGPVSGYCGYHSESQSGLFYAVIPYNAVAGHCQSDNPRPNGSTADPALSTISHEHMESITDPEAYNSWIDASGNEIGDLCITNFGPVLGGTGPTAYDQDIDGGHYWLQEEWSNASNSCQAHGILDGVTIAAPAQATTGVRTSFSGRAAVPKGHVVAYNWFFGDGGSAPGRTSAHAFGAPGRYRIVLRVTDSADNWFFATHTVQVQAPAAGAAPGSA